MIFAVRRATDLRVDQEISRTDVSVHVPAYVPCPCVRWIIKSEYTSRTHDTAHTSDAPVHDAYQLLAAPERSEGKADLPDDHSSVDHVPQAEPLLLGDQR